MKKLKILTKLQVKLNSENRQRLKRNILERTQHYGLTGLGLVLRALVRLLYGKKSWHRFDSTVTVRWVIPSYTYYISPDTIAGIDQALMDNLPPGKALDKLAQEFGVPEEEVKASFQAYNS